MSTVPNPQEVYFEIGFGIGTGSASTVNAWIAGLIASDAELMTYQIQVAAQFAKDVHPSPCT